MYQYEKLVDDLDIERNTNRNPLFDIMFTLQNNTKNKISIPGLSLEPHDIGYRMSKFDLSLVATELEEQIHFNFQYSTSLFRRETIEKFIIYFKKIVSTVVKDVNKKLSEIDILSEEEKHRLSYEFNDTNADYPKDKLYYHYLRNKY